MIQKVGGAAGDWKSRGGRPWTRRGLRHERCTCSAWARLCTPGVSLDGTRDELQQKSREVSSKEMPPKKNGEGALLLSRALILIYPPPPTSQPHTFLLSTPHGGSGPVLVQLRPFTCALKTLAYLLLNCLHHLFQIQPFKKCL
jgi:hypothetical protein